MRRQSIYLVFLFIILISMLFYFALLYLQNQGNPFVGIVILWAVVLPVLAAFPYSFSYLICLPAPIFGTWLLVMPVIEKYLTLSIYSTLLVLALSFGLVLAIHVLTRARTMFWKIPMASLSRSSIAAVSVMFFAFGIMLLSPSAFKLDIASELSFFSVTLLGYIASSMLYINSSYRLFVLSNRLEILHLEKELSKTWTMIQKKYPDKQNDLDLLQYYFYESLRGFLEGDFEKSLVWGYKAIREKTVVDPMQYIDDKRLNKPSFGEIRNTLMHPKREGHVEASKIRKIVRKLFNDCLDLLEREFAFIKNVSESKPLKKLS